MIFRSACIRTIFILLLFMFAGCRIDDGLCRAEERTAEDTYFRCTGADVVPGISVDIILDSWEHTRLTYVKTEYLSEQGWELYHRPDTVPVTVNVGDLSQCSWGSDAGDPGCDEWVRFVFSADGGAGRCSLSNIRDGVAAHSSPRIVELVTESGLELDGRADGPDVVFEHHFSDGDDSLLLLHHFVRDPDGDSAAGM